MSGWAPTFVRKSLDLDYIDLILSGKFAQIPSEGILITSCYYATSMIRKGRLAELDSVNAP